MSDELEPLPDAAEIPEPLTGLVVVRLAGERRGLDVNIVREVVPRPAVTPLPLAPPLVAGVINLRGEIIGVLDPSVLMQADGARREFAVVIEHGDTAAAILVESVEDVAWLTAAQQQEIATLDVPEILRHAQLHPPAGS
jgi:purine-binding chemotaxis protein CheW